MIRKCTIAEKWKVCECRLSAIKTKGRERGEMRALAVQTSHCEGYEQSLFSPQLRAVWSANVWLLLWGLCLCVCVRSLHVCASVCIYMCYGQNAGVTQAWKNVYMQVIIFSRADTKCGPFNVSTLHMHYSLPAPVLLNKCGMGSWAGISMCARFLSVKVAK